MIYQRKKTGWFNERVRHSLAARQAWRHRKFKQQVKRYLKKVAIGISADVAVSMGHTYLANQGIASGLALGIAKEAVSELL